MSKMNKREKERKGVDKQELFEKKIMDEVIEEETKDL